MPVIVTHTHTHTYNVTLFTQHKNFKPIILTMKSHLEEYKLMYHGPLFLAVQAGTFLIQTENYQMERGLKFEDTVKRLDVLMKRVVNTGFQFLAH